MCRIEEHNFRFSSVIIVLRKSNTTSHCPYNIELASIYNGKLNN
ncbi:hypothetical protein [Clostridium botulinum]|nr:hypothetical protein [Clostridium botulinum]